MGKDNEGKGERVFRNIYKGHINNQRVVGSRVRSGDDWGEEQMETTILKQQ